MPTQDPHLNNPNPIPDNPSSLLGSQGEFYQKMFDSLQGNILKGHGRDHAANIFIQFYLKDPLKPANDQNDSADIHAVVEWISKQGSSATSCSQQLYESHQFKKFGLSGSVFKNVFLTSRLYRKLRIEGIEPAFHEEPDGAAAVLPQQSNFLSGMKVAASDLGDALKADGDNLEALEDAYLHDKIDMMILLADDSKDFLQREARKFVSEFEAQKIGIVVSVEFGEALRNNEGEGIEHFGYVDGRSQPLFLTSDFKEGTLLDGKIVFTVTKERVNEKAKKRENGDINIWNPFASLELVLLKDALADDDHAYGSYFVFRKLEQDVMRFTMQEQNLADKLKLVGEDRERAGAMAVGRFRDGTPLMISDHDGIIPAKSNNFRYDGLDANLGVIGGDDEAGFKCPYHAHIRKTNPRQAKPFIGASSEVDQDLADRKRRITRRGIPYGDRVKAPDAFQALDDLPTKGVGLLFACFQSSITKQFAFMQKTWANNDGFRRGTPPDPLTGIDPIVGQKGATPKANQLWRDLYGSGPSNLQPSDGGTTEFPVSFDFSEFVKFKGGEFFFTPSITFFEKMPSLVQKIKK